MLKYFFGIPIMVTLHGEIQAHLSGWCIKNRGTEAPLKANHFNNKLAIRGSIHEAGDIRKQELQFLFDFESIKYAGDRNESSMHDLWPLKMQKLQTAGSRCAMLCVQPRGLNGNAPNFQAFHDENEKHTYIHTLIKLCQTTAIISMPLNTSISFFFFLSFQYLDSQVIFCKTNKATHIEKLTANKSVVCHKYRGKLTEKANLHNTWFTMKPTEPRRTYFQQRLETTT